MKFNRAAATNTLSTLMKKTLLMTKTANLNVGCEAAFLGFRHKYPQSAEVQYRNVFTVCLLSDPLWTFSPFFNILFH
jgi:hypothetical protein